MSITKRIQKELMIIQNDAIPGISASPIDETNIFEWDAIICGPEDTPYYGGVFKLKLVFPMEYPFRPPNIIFKTPIYHPNISPSGNICLDILKKEWSPALNISKVLLSISSLLGDPNPNDPLFSEAANLYKSDIEKYKLKVKEMVAKHASGL
jgi:ubiquitin-conjugating enzyme E2 D/E